MPIYYERTLEALNETTGFHGVYALFHRHGQYHAAPHVLYLESGDLYASTLIYYVESDRFFFGNIGALLESGKYTNQPGGE